MSGNGLKRVYKNERLSVFRFPADCFGGAACVRPGFSGLAEQTERALAGKAAGKRFSGLPKNRNDNAFRSCKGVFMNSFMNGFFRAMAMPNTADNLYAAGSALSKWIAEQREKSAAKERFEKSMNMDAPVLRKTVPAATGGTNAARGANRTLFGDIYAGGSAGSGTAPSGQQAPDGYEFVNRHQNESDRMLRELHQGLVDFMNSGNPDPNAAVGNNPVAPRGRHVENPVIDNRRR